ncbi:MAG: hypothetical protein WDO13_12655 [Verrucomicrobiota bacterium]
MADNRSNSIIVFGSPDIVNRVFDMVDELDRKPLQVYLRTVIGQLTVSQGMQFGIDILQKFQKIGQGGLATSNLNSAQVGSTSTGSTAPSFFPEPNTLTSAGGFPLPTGLTLYGAIGSTLDAYVRALETTDRFKIISTPSVYTTNNTLAVIASGSQVPVPSSITSGFTGAGTTTNDLATTASVAYEDVLLQLDIVPLINAKHEVTLKIRQTNNTLGNNVLISGNEVPIINTQEINTEITVPDRSTVVIGGLINDQTTRDVGGIPWLSDIPVLGYLFSNVNKSKQRDELIIMIQPSVVETDADQIAVNETEKQRTHPRPRSRRGGHRRALRGPGRDPARPVRARRDPRDDHEHHHRRQRLQLQDRPLHHDDDHHDHGPRGAGAADHAHRAHLGPRPGAVLFLARPRRAERRAPADPSARPAVHRADAVGTAAPSRRFEFVHTEARGARKRKHGNRGEDAIAAGLVRPCVVAGAGPAPARCEAPRFRRPAHVVSRSARERTGSCSSSFPNSIWERSCSRETLFRGRWIGNGVATAIAFPNGVWERGKKTGSGRQPARARRSRATTVRTSHFSG